MSDHADIVREALTKFWGYHDEDSEVALAALDALVAERDELERLAYEANEGEKELEAEIVRLREALKEAIGWIEEEDQYEEPHDDLRLRFIGELRAALGEDA